MKKKLITLALACVLTLGMSVTAFAAPSVGSPSTTQSVTTATDSNGNPVEITVTTITEEEMTEVTNRARNLYGSAPIYTADFSVAGASESNPITIRWAAPAIQAGDRVVILHKVNGVWREETNVSVTDGAVYVTVTSCSPFAMVRAAATGTNTNTNTNTNTGDDLPWAPEYYENLQAMYGGNNAAAPAATTAAPAAAVASPKTADNGVFGLAAIAVLCGAAFVLVPRKKMA